MGFAFVALSHLACGSASLPPVAAQRDSVAAVIRNPPLHLSPLKEGTWTYEILAGKDQGQTVTQVVSIAPADASAPWRRAFNANHVIAHLRLEPDGSIVMPANEILDHNIFNTFDPPQIVLPAPKALGVPLSVTSRVVSTLRSRPQMQVDHGTAELTLTPIGTETLATPAGTFACVVVELRLHLKFGLGEVLSSATLHYADGVGLVAESSTEKTTSFFLTSTTTRKIVLKSYPH